MHSWNGIRQELIRNYVFDFKKELEEYCSSDVDILRRSHDKIQRRLYRIGKY